MRSRFPHNFKNRISKPFDKVFSPILTQRESKISSTSNSPAALSSSGRGDRGQGGIGPI